MTDHEVADAARRAKDLVNLGQRPSEAARLAIHAVVSDAGAAATIYLGGGNDRDCARIMQAACDAFCARHGHTGSPGSECYLCENTIPQLQEKDPA